MRRIELLLKLQPESERRGRLPQRGRAARTVWLVLLAALAILYARNQSGIPVEPEPVASAPIGQPLTAVVTPVEPPAAAPPAVIPPPPPAPQMPVEPAPAKPPAPTVAPAQTLGVLAADPPALAFESRLVRSGSAERTSLEQRSEGQVEIRRRSVVRREIEIRSEVRSVSITNTGTAPVRIGSAELVRMESGVFAIAGDSCSGNVLAPGAGCRIRIRFLAAEAGAYSSQLMVLSDAAPVAVPVNAMVTIVDQPN
jgi:hypothetical protein